MRRKNPFDRALFFFLKGFTISVIFYLVFRNSTGYPFSTFLHRPTERFGDFGRNYVSWNSSRTSEGNLYLKIESGPSLQPVWDIAFFFFSLIPSQRLATAIYTATSVTALTGAIYVAFRHSITNVNFLLLKTLLIVCFSYPFLFCLDRGNLEWLSAIFLVFALTFDLDRPRVASSALALSIAVKPFGIVILIWYLAKKRWDDAIRVIYLYLALVISTTLFIRLYFGIKLDDNPVAVIQGYANYQFQKVDHDLGMEFGHSIFGAIKYFVYLFNSEAPNFLVPVYLVFAVLLFSILVFLNIKLDTYGINACYPLVISACLLPWVSADYKLIGVIIAGLLVTSQWSSFKSAWQVVHLYSLALVMVPKSFVSLGRGAPKAIDSSVSASILLSPLLLSVLLVTHYAEMWQLSKRHSEIS